MTMKIKKDKPEKESLAKNNGNGGFVGCCTPKCRTCGYPTESFYRSQCNNCKDEGVSGSGIPHG